MTNISHTEDELSNVEKNRLNFIGEYCEKCVGNHNRCWCNSSNWDEELVDIKSPTNNADPNLESENHLINPLDNPLPDGLNLDKGHFQKQNHAREQW